MISIAIDGPAGAGKSTIAKEVSKKLGYIYIDTGAMYRAIGLYALENNVNPKNIKAVVSLLPLIDLKIKFIDDIQKVFLNDEDVSDKIRQPEVSMAASDVSAIKEVRAFLLDLQKNMAKSNNVLMDGRDIGTVVLPNADVKIFLTASNEERAKRRYNQLASQGKNVSYQDVLDDIIKRDYNDSNRDIAPLKPADDAIIVDTTGEILEQSVKRILDIIKEKANETGTIL